MQKELGIHFSFISSKSSCLEYEIPGRQWKAELIRMWDLLPGNAAEAMQTEGFKRGLASFVEGAGWVSLWLLALGTEGTLNPRARGLHQGRPPKDGPGWDWRLAQMDPHCPAPAELFQ